MKDKHSVVVSTRMPAPEKARVAAVACAEGKPLSHLIREILVEETNRRLREQVAE